MLNRNTKSKVFVFNINQYTIKIMLQTAVEITTTESTELVNDVTLFIENKYVIIPISKSCQSDTNLDLAITCNNLNPNPFRNTQGRFLSLKLGSFTYNYLNFPSEPNGEYSFDNLKDLNEMIKVKNMKEYEDLVEENKCGKDCIGNKTTFLIFVRNDI